MTKTSRNVTPVDKGRLIRFQQVGNNIVASVMSGNNVDWVCETLFSGNVSADIAWLNRLVKREFPMEKFDLSIPVAWLLA